MNGANGTAPTLRVDEESIAHLRSLLDRLGYDTAQQFLRPDYFTSPFPHYEDFAAAIADLDAPLAVACRLLALGQPVPSTELERALGRDFIEAALVVELLDYDPAADAFATNGYTIVSRLGQLFAVSTNPYYPTFRPTNAGVYMGPDSYALVAHLQRLAPTLPAHGRALDLCAGGGIAGMTLAATRPEQAWLAVDLSPGAVAAARFDAALNGLAARYRAEQGDLYAAAAGAAFDLIVCNPPFIPVPTGLALPLYGDGGEDGLAIVRPLVEGLGRHLTETGVAVIYAEGIGDAGGPLLTDVVRRAADTDALDVEVWIVADAPIERALYTLGLILSRQRPSRLEEIVHWKTSFERQGASRYFKLFLVARRGTGTVTLTSVARPL